MPMTIGWPEIALRLALTVVAGTLIGVDRGEHGHAAGLRTTLLVCLAASVSMLQVNLLLPVAGKTSGSFAVLDLMRLPLGILSGMGFIGAGAIVRKDSLVHGLTTAASLWFVTVLGLCFGGGQLALGLAVLALGILVLRVLKRVESRWKQDRHATLSLTVNEEGPTEDDITSRLRRDGYEIGPWAVTYIDQGSQRQLRAELRWRARPEEAQSPAFLQGLVHHPGVLQLEWKP
jgi:putative Mg2+ transporter-C (MgtC) family protein